MRAAPLTFPAAGSPSESVMFQVLDVFEIFDENIRIGEKNP